MKFSNFLFEFFDSYKSCFDGYQIDFLTNSLSINEMSQKYSNINLIYDNEFGPKQNVEYINKYYLKYDFIILHSLFDKRGVFHLNKDTYNKIVWRTWGHDSGFNSHNHLYKYLLFIPYEIKTKKVINKFSAICIANIVDKIDIRKKYKKPAFFRINYSFSPIITDKEIIDNRKLNSPDVNILVGHSGYKNDNHIKIFKKLKHLINENVKIYVLLSYGNADYIQKVKKYGTKILHNKIIFIENFYKYDEYLKLLSNMDCIILDGKKSYALGTINIMLNMNKRIFINSRSLIRKAFDICNVPYLCSNKISKLSIDYFVNNSKYDLPDDFIGHNIDYYIDTWRKLFDYLASLKG